MHGRQCHIIDLWCGRYRLHIGIVQGGCWVDNQIRANKIELINSNNSSIVREIYHMKKSGHNSFHGIDIISPKE
jgi:hypothetical protein